MRELVELLDLGLEPRDVAAQARDLVEQVRPDRGCSSATFVHSVHPR